MKRTLLLLTMIFPMLLLMQGCGKDNIKIPSEDWVSLSEIEGDERFASLPLVSTKWKLLGFADEEQGRFKDAEPVGEKLYTLIFGKNGWIEGFTIANILTGKFSRNGNELKIESWTATEVGEGNEAKFYIESLNKVYTYRIAQKGLVLYYAEDKAMLFQPID